MAPSNGGLSGGLSQSYLPRLDGCFRARHLATVTVQAPAILAWHKVTRAVKASLRSIETCWGLRCTYIVYNVNGVRYTSVFSMRFGWLSWFSTLPSGFPFHLLSPLHTSFLPLSFHTLLPSCHGILLLVSLARSSVRPFVHARTFT